jgi:hypothetical protein
MDQAPGTFTRAELDDAEPERRPSRRFRWVIGFGMGAFGTLYTGFPLGVVGLPFAFTAAGAGTLLGTGFVFLLSLVFGLIAWWNADLIVDGPAFLAWVLPGLVALVAGLIATAVVVRRSRQQEDA